MDLNLVAACGSAADADALWDRIVDGLPEGVILETGAVRKMPREEVVPGSPLAVQIGDGVQAATT